MTPNKQCEDVGAARWLDRDTKIRDVKKWRACFPNARCAYVRGNPDLVDADLAKLVGVKEVHLDLRGWQRITDAGLAHLTGAVRTLNIEGCAQITDAGLAHLTGIHTLNIWGCAQITDAGLVNLTGIHTLNIWGCAQITDAGLAHLTGIHTLDMSYWHPQPRT